jgi:uncharacterized membrane protein (UPF0127 family)
MRWVHVCNLSNTTIHPINARYCASYLCRLRGLTFRRHLAVDEGLLLVQTRENRWDAAIHMFGMWLNLAIVWINTSGTVVDVKLAYRWQSIYIPRRPARYVLELNQTHIHDFKIGDTIRIED